MAAEPKRPERCIVSPRARFPANQGCGSDEVGNVLVPVPQQPLARGASTSALGVGTDTDIRINQSFDAIIKPRNRLANN